MKKICTYTVILTACWLLFAGAMLRQERLASKLIRIHILANSNSAEDQTEKLEVRDAVLQKISVLTSGCSNRKEASAVLIAHAGEIAAAASESAGRSVRVSLDSEWYDTRRYDGFSLPAGKYLSLQIHLGEAKGKNWWCVAFPSVCTAATAEEMETVAVSAGFTDGDLRMMTAKDTDVEVRFFLLELIASIREKLESWKE